MKRFIDEFKTTTNRMVYIRCKRRLERIGCFICPPNQGCNRKIKRFDNNWKRHRKAQYKN